MIQLYQFPISHYCEKVRWALDYKGVPWRPVNLLPGLHLRTTRKLAPATSVPILEAAGQRIQGSGAILDWLDEACPERGLTPADPLERDEALAWEAYADRELGPHVRRFAYHTLLDHPALVKPFFLQDGAWWWRPFLTLTYPKLSAVMRKVMKIDQAGAEESRSHIEQALHVLSEAYRERDFLVGGVFSRADLAAAALVAPLFMAPGYGLKWPATLPAPLGQWAHEWRDSMAWAERLYRDHRPGA